MDIYAVIGLGVIGAVLAVLLSQYRAEYAILISIAVGIAILYSVFRNAWQITNELESYIALAGINRDFIITLLKSLGICFLVQFASDICKDMGQTAIAGKVELAGKITVLISALPLFSELIGLALKLVSI
ncbi:MAG: stage III sporulation protein AD [Oscillospiraceae bacterium]|nr:stage III sporulation protein AD [Oscillospiraceae bacterium]MBQ9939277.1 stage III sporulation protein AD [Oscillospiraceae bacterium]